MTKKKNKPNLEEIKQSHPAWKRHKEQLAAARNSLAELSATDLFNVISQELDRRRLDEQGNPTNPDGLYWATMTGVGGLLFPTENSKAVERVAAIGRGVGLSQEAAASEYKEIALLLEVVGRGEGTTAEKAKMLAATWSKRFGREVDPGAIERVLLSSAAEDARILEVWIAIRGYHTKEGTTEREKEHKKLRDGIRKSLKRWRL